MSRGSVVPPLSVEAGYTVAGLSAPNRRGRPSQDRHLCGHDGRGVFLLVADGIGGGDFGAEAAAVAIAAAALALATGPFDELNGRGAVAGAQAAVRAMLGAAAVQGGTTLTVALLADEHLSLVGVGDSPVYAATGTRVQRLTPVLTGPLVSWVGQTGPLEPWSYTFRLPRGVCLLACTDGVQPVLGPDHGADPWSWVHAWMTHCRNDDDATVTGAVAIPTGVAGRPPTAQRHSLVADLTEIPPAAHPVTAKIGRITDATVEAVAVDPSEPSTAPMAIDPTFPHIPQRASGARQ